MLSSGLLWALLHTGHILRHIHTNLKVKIFHKVKLPIIRLLMDPVTLCPTAPTGHPECSIREISRVASN